MKKDPDSDTSLLLRRRVLQSSIAGLFTGTIISAASTPAAGQENETDTNDEDANDEDANDEDTNDEEDEENEHQVTCDGSPSMSRTSVTTPNSRITTDDPAVVEANFRPDPLIPDGCTIMVDLEFSFTDAGFQWGGGAEWDQATSDLVVGTFEVRPGEIRDIRAELHTQGAEAGDTVTVVADYEIWFEGNPEESVQQSGIRHTIDVEAPNPAPDDPEEASIIDQPGFGIPTAIGGIGGAAYIKSKLVGNDE